MFGRLTGWGRYVIGDTYSAANEGLKGRRIGDIARERGERDFFTLARHRHQRRSADGAVARSHRRRRAKLAHAGRSLEHPYVMIGGSDAGAHLDRMCGAPYTTGFLADCIRGRRLASRKAVHLMTDVPARLFGLRDAVAASPRAGSPISWSSTRRRSTPATSCCAPTCPGLRPALRRSQGHRAGLRQRSPHRCGWQIHRRTAGHRFAVGPPHRHRAHPRGECYLADGERYRQTVRTKPRSRSLVVVTVASMAMVLSMTASA